MGASYFSKHDLEMISISWSFVRNKQKLGLNTMTNYSKLDESVNICTF